MSQPTGPDPAVTDTQPDARAGEHPPAGDGGRPADRPSSPSRPADPAAGPGPGLGPREGVHRLAELLLEAADPEPGGRAASQGGATAGPATPTIGFALADAGPVLESFASSLGDVPRVLLSDTGADESPAPLVQP